tara:strand:- start:49 stop:768 length:720 start_codon:yes stop_codon:yes gene_type:complete
MEKAKKIKLFVGMFYLILVTFFLYFFFSKFSLQEITTYEFIKNNRDNFNELKKTNFYFLAIAFFLFTIIWVLAGGFGSPIGIFAGFIFGKWIGILILIFGMSIGATGLYVFANYFLKNLIREKFLQKYQNLEMKFKKSEFLYLLIYRFIGGIPFGLSHFLPCLFNVKVSNFFWATFIGITPQLFLVCSIGSGLEKIIENNLQAPGIFQIIKSPDIYLPLIIFAVLVIITIFLRKKFYKN